jgi:hypothetical protein
VKNVSFSRTTCDCDPGEFDAPAEAGRGADFVAAISDGEPVNGPSSDRRTFPKFGTGAQSPGALLAVVCDARPARSSDESPTCLGGVSIPPVEPLVCFGSGALDGVLARGRASGRAGNVFGLLGWTNGSGSRGTPSSGDEAEATSRSLDRERVLRSD